MLNVTDLSIKHRGDIVVDSSSFTIQEGEWFALVGESGSGKSVTASAIAGLLSPNLTRSAGSIFFQNQNLAECSKKELQKIRGKNISYVFQDYQGAFTPFIRIGKQFDEMLKTHTTLSKQERKDLSVRALIQVQLPAERVYRSYPFQLSGGQLQRAAIAMATILRPKLLIADEATTALDSMTAVKVLKLIHDLQKETNCAVLFITHDLRHVRKYADKVAVMQEGKIVESGQKTAIFEQPEHLYTKQLFAAIPSLRDTPDRLLTVNEKELHLR